MNINNIKKVLLLVCLVAYLIPAYAQQTIERGDVYYDFFQYKEAIVEYEKALKESRTFQNEGHLLTQLAYCHMYTFQYAKAERYFAELVKLGDKKAAPEAYLHYGNILKIQGKYEKAKDQFNYYNTLIKDDVYAKELLRSLNWAIRNKDSVRQQMYIAPTNLDVGGQSLGYCFYMDGLIYSATRDSALNEFTPLFDLRFAHQVDSVTFKPGEDYLADVAFKFNEGSPAMGPDGETLYFTATATKIKSGQTQKIGKTEISEDGVSNLKLYSAHFENGRFTQVQELSFNNKQYNTIHPCLNEEGNIIYFASDMPGGYGGLDLYKSTRQSDGNWGSPVNLGEKVNTPEHESFPYLFGKYLFFASKGHVGYGGYDLFRATLGVNESLSDIKNLGKPYNSSKDDAALIFNKDGHTGYLSSNRDNGDGIDKVYYFDDNYVAPSVKPVRDTQLIASVRETAKQALEKGELMSVKANEQVKVNAEKGTAVKGSARIINSPKELGSVSFAFNSKVPEGDMEAIIAAYREAAKGKKQVRIALYASTDCRGSEAYNKQLSARRGAEVKKQLVSRGVPEKAIKVIALGETEATKNCISCEQCTEEQHGNNRRVDVRTEK